MAGVKFRRGRRLPAVAILIAGWLLCLTAFQSLGSTVGSGSDADQSQQPMSASRRHLLSSLPLPSANACTPRSIETFPPDLISTPAKKHGAILLHILVATWLFAALAVVCDEYFVASLEILCDVMKLKPDVAGATFMAAGSSAPELFTSVIGVFFADSDVGVSTIVGSAVFNLLFIVSLCGIFATQTIYLSWWPMFRDCGYYSVTVISLIAVIFNEEVHWYEALTFIVMYIGYIVIMYFNEQLDGWLAARFPSLATGGNQRLAEAGPVGLEGAASRGDVDDSSTSTTSPGNHQLRLDSRLNFDNAALDDSEDTGDAAVETAQLIISDGRNLSAAVEQPLSDIDLQQQQLQQQQQQLHSSLFAEPKVEVSVEPYESPLSVPKSLAKRFYWAAMLPWHVAFVITIPDCRRPGRWRKVFFITLMNSILWIAGMSYLLVWMVCAVGDTLGIPDTVMGLTLLAAGTSVPDALASVFVARDGFGDMAVSNSVGSNVFDILIGLGLPWLVSTGVKNPGSFVTINSAGLTYSSITLLSTVVLLFVSVYFNKMRLDFRLGVVCFLLYCLFITVSVLFEMNVFAKMNPPPCPRNRH